MRLVVILLLGGGLLSDLREVLVPALSHTHVAILSHFLQLFHGQVVAAIIGDVLFFLSTQLLELWVPWAFLVLLSHLLDDAQGQHLRLVFAEGSFEYELLGQDGCIKFDEFG